MRTRFTQLAVLVALVLVAILGVQSTASAHPGHAVVVNKSNSSATIYSPTSTLVLRAGDSTETRGMYNPTRINTGSGRCFTYTVNTTSHRLDQRACSWLGLASGPYTYYIWSVG